MSSHTISISLTLSGKLNTSLQIGDSVYWNNVSQAGAFDYKENFDFVMHIGVITLIKQWENSIIVLSPYVTDNGNPMQNIIPPTGSFISFSKNNVVNNNDLTGYYTNVQFSNNSKIKAELFSVGSGVSESSK